MSGPPLQGQTAIVTGGAGGVGFSIARALTLAGSTVHICDIRDDVDEAARALTSDGHVVGHLADVSVDADVRRVIAAASAATGTVDILVNNAGISFATPLSESPDAVIARFDAIMATNLRGVYLFGRHAIPLMVDHGGGHIVNVATDHIHNCGWPEAVSHSDAADCPWSDVTRRPGTVGMDAYDASKWALNGLTQDWAKSLRAAHVRVNNLCLGATDSAMIRGHYGFDDTSNPPPDELRSEWQDPDAVADVIIALIMEGPDGRSGDNVGLWRGHPTVLPPPSPRLNIPLDFERPVGSGGQTKGALRRAAS